MAETYTLDPRPNYPFLITANRYVPPTASEDGLTLIFAHGTGFHKEQWEVVLEDMYQQKRGVRIRDVWSIEAPNHGDSALLNEEELKWGYEGCCACFQF